MSKFAKFMKANKVVKENEFYAVTASLCDDNGEPLKWEFRHLSSKENNDIRENCMFDEPVKGRANMYRPKLKTNQYIQKILTSSIVFPDLYDKELQDSYGVSTPEALLYEMVDDPGEYNDLIAFVQKLQGFDASFNDKVEEAKN